MPRYVEIEGLKLPETFLPGGIRFASEFKPSVDDIIVSSYVKCGTTWMCQIVKLILEKGDNLQVTSEEYFKSFPFLELHGESGIRNMSKPGCIKTHLSFDRLNFSEHAKYIYVTRHPRDCVVSLYHHLKFFPIYRFTHGTFDDFFDLFVKDKVDYKGFFDNLLSWYEQRHRPNILFFTYESTKADHRGTILKIADFLGCELYDVQIDNVVKFSGFEYMKNETDTVFNQFSDSYVTETFQKRRMQLLKKAIEDGHDSVGDFMRRGVVGEGKLLLSEDQEKRLRIYVAEKTRGSDVMSLWSEE